MRARARSPEVYAAGHSIYIRDMIDRSIHSPGTYYLAIFILNLHTIFSRLQYMVPHSSRAELLIASGSTCRDSKEFQEPLELEFRDKMNSVFLFAEFVGSPLSLSFFVEISVLCT